MFPVKLLRIALIAITAIVALIFGGASLLGTSKRPVPAQLPGYRVIPVAMSHRANPVLVHVWYPADNGTGAELVGQNALFYGHYVRRDAKPAAGLHPLVLLSHGSGGNAERMGWLATELANRGMIVAAPDHPGTTSGDSDPFQTVKVWERPQDLSAIIDFIAANKVDGLTPDMKRVAVVGFSLGGFSALSLSGVQVSKTQFIDYCNVNRGQLDCGWMQAAGVDFTTIDQTRYEQSNADPRIKVTVAIDPALPAAMVVDSLTKINQPVLVVNLGDPNTIPPAMRVDAIARSIHNSSYVAVPGAHHFSFMAECSWLGYIVIGIAGEDNICSDTGFRNRSVLHKELAPMIVEFLDKALGKM
jgi:predicted dienelactone hydrolase